MNCAVEKLFDGFHINAPHEPTEDWYKETKKLAWEAHKEVSKKALDVGSEVHNAIHGNMEVSSDEAKACLRGYEDFKKKFLPVKLVSELRVYNITDLVAGTIDWVGLGGNENTKNGKGRFIWIIDWKTSSSIQHNYKVQLVVYKWMLSNYIQQFVQNPNNYDETTTRLLNTIVQACGKKPKIKLKIVRLNKKLKARNTFEVYDITPQEEKLYLEEFKLMLKINKHRRKYANSSDSR